MDELRKAKADIIAQHDDPDSFAVEFAQIDEIEAQLAQKLTSPNVDFAEIDKLTKQSDELLHKVVQMRKDGSLNVKLNKLKDKIDSVFEPKDETKMSPGEANIRARWKDLYNQAQDQNLTKEEKLILHEKINALRDVIDKVKELETVFDAYKTKENEYSKSNEGGTNVPTAIAAAQNLKDDIQTILSTISLNEKTPTAASIDQLIRQVKDSNTALELAYAKDKILAANNNFEILKTQIPQDPESGEVLKDSIDKLISYAKSKQNIDSTTDAKDSQELMSNEVKLVHSLTEAIKAKAKITQNSLLPESEAKQDTDVLAKIIAQNLPNVETDPIDTPEIIAAKVAKVNNAIAVTEQKHELRKTLVNNLHKILPAEQNDWKIYGGLKTKLDALETKYRNILNSDPSTYSPEEIERQEKELKAQIAKLEQEKAQIDKDYEDAKQKSEQTKNELGSRINILKEQNKDSFPIHFTNYEAALAKYEEEIASRPNSTTKSLKEKEQALKEAYFKDLAIHKKEEFKSFVSQEIDTLDHADKAKVKDVATAFNNYAEDLVKKPLDESKVEEFINISREMKAYNKTQADIVKFIKELEESDEPTKDKALPQLKLLLESAYYPTQPYSVTDIQKKTAEINRKWEEIKAEAAIRSENRIHSEKMQEGFKDFVAKPELSDGKNTKRKAANELLESLNLQDKTPISENSVDKLMPELANKALAKLIEDNKKATSLEQLKNVKEHIETVDKIQPYIDALGLQIASVEAQKDDLERANTELTQSYAEKYLSTLITKAREDYGLLAKVGHGEQNLKDAFAKRIKELDQAKALVKDVKKLEELLKNVEEINKNTNYSEVKGIQGNSNIKTVNEWLQKIVNEAAYDQLNQSVEAQRAKIEQASLKVEATKKHLEKQKEVADKIAAWKAQRDADSKYSSTLKDEEQLTSNMWKILVELTATTSDVDTINSKTRALTDALTTQEAIRTKRVETRELIDSIKEESSYEQAGHYPQLKQLLDTKITQLKTQKRNGDTIEQLQQVQDEVALVKQILPKQVELGAKVSEIIQFNAALIPLNTEIAQKQTELSNALAEAEKLLVKEVPTKAEITQRIADIDKTIKTLDLHKARVNVFQEWTEIKQKVDDNDTIFAEEKIALTEILQRFTTELNAIKLDENTDATQFKNILNKYIEGETEQSVPYLLKLSEELSDTLSKAKDVLETNVRVEGENVSSSAVKALYDDLTKYVDESKTGIQNRSKASIENKKEIIKNTRLKVRAIIDEKVNSIKGVRAKAHELKVVALKHSELNSAVGNDFEQNAITALTDMPAIDYTNAIVEIKRLDSAIAKAIAANTKAIKSIYEIQHRAINHQYNAANSLIESINVKDIWTTTTSNKYNEIKTLLTSLKEYSIQKIYQDDALKKFAELETTHNFVTEYLNRNLELVAEAKEKISTFKTSAKGDIESILGDSGKVKKFIDYVSSKDTITSSQPQASNSAKSKLEAVGFSDIKGIYDRVSSEYSTNKDISSLSLTDQNVNEIQKHLLNSKKLIEEIDSFFSKLKEKTTEFLRVRDTTDEIMNYVFKEEHRADGRRTIDAIYNPKRDELKSEEQKITKTKADNFISDSFINSVENDIFAKLYDFKNIMSTDGVKSAFKAILNTETPEVKNTVLPSEFKKELEAITNQATGDTLEITYNDRLLQMFNKFGNTTIDNSAKFNPVYVKVYLVKDTQTGSWFTEDSKNETNQKVKIKVKYEYKPDNLNIFADDLKGFDDEKEYTITLTNAKSLGLANKSRHIFYNDKNEHGYNAKQVIGNVGDLGWDVTEKDKVIEKVVQKISKAFGIENGKSILISHGENKIYDLVKAGVNNNPSGSLNEKSELNLEKSNIKFIFPEFHIYQQSSSINSFNSKQYVSLSADNKTITAKIIVPSNLIVGKQNWSENKNSIHEERGLIDDSKAMPSALINTIKFSFDYDQNKKDISMYISHYDSYHLAKHKSLQADGIFKVEGDKVIQNDVNNSNQATYIWTGDQFAKYLAIHESEWDASKVSQIKEKYATAGTDPTQKKHGNGYSGKEITGKFWVKNPRSAGEYIKTNSESQPQTQQTLNGTDMAAVFNSGIEIFKFEDIKES
ncbi:hypothetical protein [Mycoplasmopsis californica]|uniref:hypothetical protein n=1 Tax=Mycoplasmopsis californica TaxID=2113 RepID=UPI000F62A55C|nr:hypothetical protein [Mycoplasmopsis californica]